MSKQHLFYLLANVILASGYFFAVALNASLLSHVFFLGVLAVNGVSLAIVSVKRKASNVWRGQDGVENPNDIANRSRAEIELRASEDRYRDLVENSQDLICTHDLEGRILSVNPAAARMIGYSQEEISNKNLGDFLIPGAGGGLAEYLAVIKQKGAVRGLMAVRTRTGEKRIWEYSNNLRVDGVSAPIVRGIARDVTERVHAEKALRESEARYRALAEAAHDMIFVIDQEGRVEYANVFAARQFGRKPEEIVGKQMNDLFPPQVSERQGAAVQRVLETGESYYAENKTIFPNGDLWLGTWLVPLREAGRVRAVLGVSRDITESKRAQEELQRLEEFNEGIVQNMTEGIAIEDAEGFFTFVNPAAAALLGYLPAELIGKHWTFVIPPDQHNLVQSSNEHRARGESERYEIELVRKDGVRLSVQVSASPRMVNGQFAGSLAVFTDITERKRMERRLEQTTWHQQQLLETARFLNESLDVKEVLARIAVKSKEIVNASGCAIYHLEADGKTLTPVAAIEPPYEEAILATPLDVDQSFTGKAVKARRGLIINTREGGIHGQVVPGRDVEINGERIIVVPFITDHQVLGGMCLNRFGAFFTDEDLALAEGLSVYAAVALKNAQAHRRLAYEIETRQRAESAILRRNKELAALNETGGALARLVEPAEMIALIASTIGRVIDNRNLYIALYDETTQFISFPFYTVHGERTAVEGRPFRNGITEYIIRTRRPLLVTEDIAGALSTLGIALIGTPAQSFLGVPMVVGEKVIGVIAVQDYERTNVYDANHLQVLSTIAAQAAAAFENARLFAETRQRADEFTALYDTARDLATVQDLGFLLKTIIERASQLLNVANGTICLYDQARNDLEIVASLGEEMPSGTRFAIGEGATGRVAQEREPILISDYQTWEFRSPKYEGKAFASAVAVPMIYRGELIGTLDLIIAKPSSRRFTEEDVRILSLFAGQAAGAVHNARLLQETRQRAEQLELLYNSGLALARTSDSRAQLSSLFRDAVQALRADDVAFFRYTPAQRELKFEFGIGDTARIGAAHDLRFSLGEERGLVGWVAQNRTPLYLPDVLADPRWITVDPSLRSALWVPITYENELLGVVAVVSRRLNAFTFQDEQMLMLFANQWAAALENARLFADIASHAQRQQALYRISNAIAGPHDPYALCQVVASAAREVLGYPYLGVFLLDPANGDRVLKAQSGWDDAPADWRLKRGEGLSERAILTGTLHYSPDTTREPKYVPGLKHCRSEVDVPIKVNDIVIGVMIIEDTRVDAFKADDFAVLQAVANQLGTALEKTRLFEETLQRLAELEAVHKVSVALRAAQSLEEMLPILLNETLAVIGTDTGSIRLDLSGQGDLVSVAARGWLTEIQTSVRKDQGVSGYVFGTGEPYVLREFVDDSRITQSARERIPTGWGGAVVPIRSPREIVGVLVVAVQLPRELTEREVRLLTTLAEIAGNAIHRTLLFEQTTEHVARLTALRTIDNAINASFDLRLTLDVVLSQVITLLKVDAAAVLTLDASSNMLTYVASRGFRTRAIERSRLRLGEGFAGRAAFERRTCFTNNLPGEGTAYARASLLASEGFVSYYGTPLTAKGKIKGVLEVYHRTPLNSSEGWIDFLETLASQVAIAVDNAELFNTLQRSNNELVLAYDDTIAGWSRALDLRDKETEGHTLRVTDLTDRLVRALGIKGEELVHIRRGALLHDIGKMGIPDSILLKPGQLTPAEWEVMRKHPQNAYDLIFPIAYLRPALDIPYCHHEKWDGTGYPRRLKGEQIPLVARVFAVVDVWDALTSDRPYRPAWSREQAREYIREQAGKHFDPQVVEIFLKVI